MSTETLVIPRVNFEDLERQRLSLLQILEDEDVSVEIGKRDKKNLEGLLNMLDYWSDCQYRKEDP